MSASLVGLGLTITAATGQAESEARDAWESVQAALKELETRIRVAVDDL